MTSEKDTVRLAVGPADGDVEGRETLLQLAEQPWACREPSYEPDGLFRDINISPCLIRGELGSHLHCST